MLKTWKKSLLVQIVSSFSLLSLAIVALIVFVTFTQARKELQQSVFERLTAAAALKEGELNRWLMARRDTLLSLSQLSAVETSARTLLSQEKSTPEHQQARETLQDLLGEFIQNRSDYREVFILSKGGRVLMSTNPEQIGAYTPPENHREVSQGEITTVAANFYPAPETKQPTVTFTTPILNEAGQRLGLMAVHLNLDPIDEIIRNSQGLGATGEPYLIANLGSNFASHNVFVSAAGFGSEEFPDGVDSPGITAAMAGNDDSGLYLNYRGLPVIGVYRWLEGQDVALLVEMEQTEAFIPARRLAKSIALMGLCLAGLLAIGIVMVARRIVNPIVEIANTARTVETDVKAGRFSTLNTVPILTENEIGLLAQTFNQMTQQLHTSYQELQTKNENLGSTLTELQETQGQLIQNEKMASLGQMVAGIAHEVNNPVSFIHGNLKHLDEYTQNLLELLKLYETEYPTETTAIAEAKEEIDLDFLEADLAKVLGSMRMGTTRIREIVLSLRNFSRLDEADLKEADVHEGLESTLLILDNRLKATSERPAIQVIKDYDSIPQIRCYPGQLNQVFLNLISNAIDALEPDAMSGKIQVPTIRIHTAVETDSLSVCIADNGSGIPEETRRKIFDPFFTTKPVGKGTGLGLSISYSIIVKNHQGEFNCASSPEEGTKFTIVIPI